MHPKKENRKMMDMLERMGVVKRTEEDQPLSADEYDAVEEYAEPAAAPEETAAPAVQPVYEPPVAPVQDTYQPSVPQQPIESAARDSFWDNDPSATLDADRFMDVEELYRAFGLGTHGTDTVYLLEDYMKTLPDSLPAELRRSIILKIVSASGFDFDKLLNDGIDRVSKLNDYASTFSSHTDEQVARLGAEIDALERQIQHVREIINDRKNLHKKQFLAIENEGQRLKEILDFITK